MGFQYQGQIYYRALEQIEENDQLLTFYGKEYALEEIQRIGNRDPKEFGHACQDCHTQFKDVSCLAEHLKSCAAHS